MPHVRDVRATSHDQHDAVLVSALAAGDLASPDRDLAIALIRECADCFALHDDLIAIARATKAVPPPFATAARDFRLTPADAARLQPGGWRRIAAAFGGVRSGFGRPLGVGLATLGVLGLLVGNIELGGNASMPREVGQSSTAASSAEDTSKALAAPSDLTFQGAAGAAAASAAPASMGFEAASSAPQASAAASAAPDVAVAPEVSAAAPAPDASGPASRVSADASSIANRQAVTEGIAGQAAASSFDLVQIGSIVAIVAGLAVLVLTTLRSRRQT